MLRFLVEERGDVSDDNPLTRYELALTAVASGTPADPYEWRLPPGRHGLPREYVLSNQRQRILSAVVHTVANGGYAGYTVQRLLRQAGVSRRTFYNLFEDRDDAFLQMYDVSANCLLERTEAAWLRAGDDPDGSDRTAALRRCLGALLDSLAGQPVLARVCFIDVLSAGPAGIEHRERHLRRFTAPLRQAIAEHSGNELAPLIVDGRAGAIYELIYSRIAQGRTDELPNLLDDLYAFCLMPFRHNLPEPAPAQE